MDEKLKWRFCTVGNIVRSHIDENGIIRYGTPAYKGGTKVYICDKFWNRNSDTIGVIGISRGKKFYFASVPIDLIENVRVSKVYSPRVLEQMGFFEFDNDWWKDTQADRDNVSKFVHEFKAILEARKGYVPK